jgi:preprotein translocase subunit SecB|tara:strand:+ start:3558 stop:4001 length:444 start_codon:yes stop_codon:yes gene_type:complete
MKTETKTTNKKYEILAEFVKDMSSETPDIETFIFVKGNIKNYHLNIDLNSKPIKNKIIEVNTILKFEDKNLENKKSHFEITYTAVVKIDDDVDEKKELEKIILCDVPKTIYPNLEKIFLTLLISSGLPEVKIEKKVDFEKLFNERLN